jgi:ribosomal protein S15P/S13E
MRNNEIRTTKTGPNDAGLNQLLAEARMEERRARAEVMASRMVNLANHIKTNQLDINEVLELLLQESETYQHQAMEIH